MNYKKQQTTNHLPTTESCKSGRREFFLKKGTPDGSVFINCLHYNILYDKIACY